MKRSSQLLATVAAGVLLGGALALAQTDINPGVYLLQRGLEALRDEQPLKALAAFNLAAEMEGETEALSRFYLGESLVKLGQDEHAAAEFAKALSLGLPPEETSLARAYIGQLNMRQVRTEEKPQELTATTGRPYQLVMLAKLESLSGISVIPTLENLLTPSRDSDSRMRVLLSAAYFLVQDVQQSLSVGYMMDTYRYRDRDDLNTISHGVYLNGQKFIKNGTTVGGTLMYSHGRVDHRATYNLYSAGGWVSFPGLMNKAMRLGYTYSNIDYVRADDYDTEIHAFSLTQRLLATQTAFTDFAFTFSEARAGIDEFSYQGFTTGFNGYWVPEDKHSVTWSIAHDRQNYQGRDSVQTDERRHDRVWRLNAGYAYEVHPGIALTLDAGWESHVSNIIRQDFIARNVGVGLQVIY